MPHLYLLKGAGFKNDAALRQQRTARLWVQGRVFGVFAAGEKSITSHNENFCTLLSTACLIWLQIRTR
jgi:hypothetical protein